MLTTGFKGLLGSLGFGVEVSPPPQVKFNSDSYLMPLFAFEGHVYLGGYDNHPFPGKDLPPMLEFGQIPVPSVEDISGAIQETTILWLGDASATLTLLEPVLLTPMVNVTIYPVIVHLSQEPSAPRMVKRPVYSLQGGGKCFLFEIFSKHFGGMIESFHTSNHMLSASE